MSGFHRLDCSQAPEYAGLVLGGSAFFIILGLLMIMVASRALRAPSEKHELAAAIGYRGLWSLGIGLCVAVAYWLFGFFKS
jgi:hypothetical protein